MARSDFHQERNAKVDCLYFKWLYIYLCDLFERNFISELN